MDKQNYICKDCSSQFRDHALSYRGCHRPATRFSKKLENYIIAFESGLERWLFSTSMLDTSEQSYFLIHHQIQI